MTYQLADGTLQQIVLDLPEDATLQDIAELVPGEPVKVEPVPRRAPEHPARERPAGRRAPGSAPRARASSPPRRRRPRSPLRPRPRRRPRAGPGPRRRPPPSRPSSPSRSSCPPSASRSRARPTASAATASATARRPSMSTSTTTGPAAPRPKPLPIRRADGAPTPANPSFMDALPGPSFRTGVPNFVIRKFRVPVFLLPIYQAAGIEYGIRWEILAAINEIETDYGRNLNVSSAGRGRLDAVHALDLGDVRDRRQQGRAQGPLQPGRRDLRRRPLPGRGRLRGGRPARDLRLQPRRLVRRLGDAPRPADRRRARRPGRLADRTDRGRASPYMHARGTRTTSRSGTASCAARAPR